MTMRSATRLALYSVVLWFLANAYLVFVYWKAMPLFHKLANALAILSGLGIAVFFYELSRRQEP